MEKSKLLTIAVVSLLIINLGILSFLFFKSGINHHLGRGGEDSQSPKEIIEERLHFDSSQIRKFHELVDIHHEKMHLLSDKSREIRNGYYQLLENDSISSEIYTKELERERYQE